MDLPAIYGKSVSSKQLVVAQKKNGNAGHICTREIPELIPAQFFFEKLVTVYC